MLKLDFVVIRNWRVREREWKFIERIFYFVGINVNMLVNMFVIDKFVSIIFMVMIVKVIKKVMFCVSFSISWKLIEIFWLKVKIYFNGEIYIRVMWCNIFSMKCMWNKLILKRKKKIVNVVYD